MSAGTSSRYVSEAARLQRDLDALTSCQIRLAGGAAKAAELIKMPFDGQTCVGTRNHLLDWCQDSLAGRGTFARDLDALTSCAHHDKPIVADRLIHELAAAVAVCRYEASLREQSGRASSEAARLQRDLDALTSCADDVDAVRRQIRSTAEALRRQLDADEAALLRRVDRLYSDECRRAVDARPALRDRVERLREIGRRADSVLEHRGVELLLLKKVKQ